MLKTSVSEMNQEEQVLFHLANHPHLTRAGAMANYGTMNLTARISDLRLRRHIDVRCKWECLANGKKFGRFYLHSTEVRYLQAIGALVEQAGRLWPNLDRCEAILV